MLDVADAETAGGNQNRQLVFIKSEFFADFRFIFFFGKNRINRNARNGDFFGRNSEFFKMNARLVECDEIPLEIVAEPHRVNVEIGNDDCLRKIDFSFCRQPRNNFGGQNCVQTAMSGL